MPKLGKCTKPLSTPKADRIKTGGGNGGYNRKTPGSFEDLVPRSKTPTTYSGRPASLKRP